MHVNIEIKARCEQPERVKTILKQQQADFKGVDHQKDTYFEAKNGRLKLREGNIENSLIFYQRSNQAGPKQSDVILYQAPADANLKAALAAAIGVKVVVDKKRAIYFIGNVKFHVDEVENLGSFVEIEAIDKDGSIGVEHLQEQCAAYMKLLHIEASDLVECSYSDLLLERQ